MRERPPLALAEKPGVGREHAVQATLRIKLEDAPGARRLAVRGGDRADVDVAHELLARGSPRGVADPGARIVAARRERRAARLDLRGPALRARCKPLSHGEGERDKQDPGKDQRGSEPQGREARCAQNRELRGRGPARHRVDGGEEHRKGRNLIGARRQREPREEERLGEVILVRGDLVHVPDEVKEREERHEDHEHEERREKDVLRELSGDDGHHSPRFGAAVAPVPDRAPPREPPHHPDAPHEEERGDEKDRAVEKCERRREREALHRHPAFRDREPVEVEDEDERSHEEI